MSASSREIRVRGRTDSGKCWKNALDRAMARELGSLTTSTPASANSWPKAMAAVAAQGFSLASSAGSLRSITTSNSPMSSCLTTSGFCTSSR